MKEPTVQVGFSQRVRLEWLDKTANLILAGNDQIDIQDALQELLADKVSIGGRSVRGNREKTITILMKIWLNVPHGLEGLRDEGLNSLRDARANHRIAIHWGMALAVYPFWGEVAAQAGRLLRLQADLTAEQVQRRIRERYGDRQTVSRATRRVLRSFIDWGVLDDTERRGRYAQGERHSITDEAMIAWLAESVSAKPSRFHHHCQKPARRPRHLPVSFGPSVVGALGFMLASPGGAATWTGR